MNLTPYVEHLRQELAIAADGGDEQARELAERLTAHLDSAVRLTLMTALSAAADEITRDLAPGSVDVRLRGGDAEFVVTQPPAPTVEPIPVDEDGVTTRLNLRLPESLKARIDDAAGKARLSANTWLVRTVTAALAEGDRTAARTGQRYTGWAR